MDVIGRGQPGKALGRQEIDEITAAGAESMCVEGKRVLVIVPDHTRTCPLPQIARAVHRRLAKEARQVDFIVALGTHPPMTDEQIDRLLGVEPGGRQQAFPGSKVFNHRWDDPSALTNIGRLPARRIDEITGGLFAMDVDVTINRLAMDYDVLLIVGPVFPHEVVGFSGGSKYLFPGISGPELLNFFHWLGAVITNPKIIGTKHTPVRATIEAAAEMVPADKYALCMVVQGEDLVGLYFGTPPDAWSAAADLSDKVHIKYMDRAFESVLSRAPQMYDDLWTGGKCMYKLEPVVADGGELIIFAPHITEISVTHGRVIEQVGYHTRDYFLKQWDKFKDYPWGVLAHSTHVRGIGTYDGGVERPRVRVTLATGVPEDVCKRINLGYRDPASIDVAEWQGREADGRLYVPKAGETLYKLKNPPAWQRFDS
ncbi:MAG TPA: lactate racemase domain-containing protein [Phycisphaerae bacterium]|nr:lactate racemase domain-containing protein [Phycisphaerae bacterium]